MIVLHVSVQVKPEHVKEFLEVVRYDAEHSEKDEPGCLRFDLIQDSDDPNRFYFCLRFDLIQDSDDPNRFYFYEVYRDEAALEAHRQTPHFKFYFEKVQPWLTAPPERRFGKNLIPTDAAWR